MNATCISVAPIFVLLFATAGFCADAPAGASSCTGCHAASAGMDAMRSLAGERGIAEAMIGFKSGQRPATIMNRLAKGFTDEEIRAIADWYAAQKP
jgi:cytochrome c553